MPNRNLASLIGALAGICLLTLLFVLYQGRTFHYCAGKGERPQARIVGSADSCGPDEEPLDWRELGWPGRIKLAARTTAKAFGGKLKWADSEGMLAGGGGHA